MKITPSQFFTHYFPRVYVCATSSKNAQFNGTVVEPNQPPEYYQHIIHTFQELNKQGHNIFFTPNGVKTVEGKNRLDNVAQINAWWIDLDIEETKHAEDAVTRARREEIKEDWRGRIWMGPDNIPGYIMPSLTIETRNGFQLYWFADAAATHEKWLQIGQSIYEKFKEMGADHSTVKIAQLMRLPMFFYFKKGEQGKIEISFPLSSFKLHSETAMQSYFKPVIIDPMTIKREPLIYKPKYVSVKKSDDIFMKVTNLPIDEVLAKLSGHWLVKKEVITLQKMDTNKSNVLVNGRGTPNFIDRDRNHIYSNNAKGCTVVAFLAWYGWREGMIAKGLRELFNI